MLSISPQILRKLRANYSILLIVLSLGMYGCISSRSLVSFEILQPAAFTYPESVNTIGYLNRSARSFDIFSGVTKDSMEAKDLYIVDTSYSYAIIRGIEEGKANSGVPYMDELLYIEARASDTINRSKRISGENVDEICSHFGLDALIVQDYYNIKFEEFNNYSIAETRMEQVIVFIQDVKWTIYVKGGDKPLDNWQFYDTLFYVNNAEIPVSSRRHKPLSIMKDGAKQVGYAFGARNVPVWNEISRIVYTGYNKELKPATKYTDEGEWEKAKEIWQQYLTSEDRRLAAKCAYNIAVHHELRDDVDSALHYVLLAREAWSSPEIEFYIEELTIRQQNRIDLQKQMRFTD